MQMTTDTAVRVTRMIIQDQCKLPVICSLIAHKAQSELVVPLEKIPYVDNPEIHLNEHESIEMPFRYVKDPDGLPIMPEVSLPPDLRNDMHSA